MEPIRDLAVVQCHDPAQWDAFVKASPQGTIFCDTRLIGAYAVEPDFWFVLRGDSIKAGLAVFRRGDEVVGNLPFTYYQGLLLSAEIDSLPVHRKSLWIQYIVDTLLSALTSRYPRLSLSLHPTLDDVRGFDWFNYHEPGKGRCRIRQRYTARVDCQAIGSTEALLKLGRKDRRQDYRRANECGLRIVDDGDVDALMRMYVQTIERQGETVSENELSTLRSVSETALAKGIGEIYFVKNGAAEPLAAQLALYDWRSGHAVASAAISSGRESGAATLACAEFVERVRSRGLRWADFNGANSPDRADFKHSLGAQPQLFFSVEWPANTKEPH